jgi:hypothetical protein
LQARRREAMSVLANTPVERIAACLEAVGIHLMKSSVSLKMGL